MLDVVCSRTKHIDKALWRNLDFSKVRTTHKEQTTSYEII